MEIERTKDILEKFPIRKSKKQKEAFRSAVMEYAQSKGYTVSFENGSFGARNIVIGDPEKAKYLVTAHYDTCARMIVPNLITPCSLFGFLAYQIFVALLMIVPVFLITGVVAYLTKSFWIAYLLQLILFVAVIWLMMAGPANPSNVNDNTSGVVTVLEIAASLPDNLRSRVCFVLFDLEESGLMGSSGYRKLHKNTVNSQIVLNLDCVGEGDLIYLFPTKKLKKNSAKLNPLISICGKVGCKSIILKKRGFSIYPSDQAQFPYGVGIAALKPSKFGPYLAKIHTPKDTVLDETNVNILRAALITYIGGAAAE